MLNNFSLASRLLWREWRAGEWVIVFFSLFFAVTAITALHFYTDRLLRGLEQQSSLLLGGDMVISSPSDLPADIVQKARSLHLKTASVWSYPSMASVSDKMQLVNIQAVSDEYPLMNASKIKPDLHSAWIDPRLLSLLSIKLGDKLTIGASAFTASRLLTSDIDTLNTGFSIAPRIMLRLTDIPETRTVLPGSRVDYRLLLVGDKKSLEDFKQWVSPLLHPGQRIITVKDQQFMLSEILQHNASYLQLALVICLLMSGVAITVSMQQYIQRHYSHVALWRCLGANGKTIRQIFFYQMLIIALTAGALGTLTGFGVQMEIAELFNEILKLPLPSPSLAPLLLGFVSSVIILFVFAYPVVLELPSISPLAIWRNETNHSSARHASYRALAFLGLLGFIFYLMGLSLLTLFLLDIILLCIGVLFALSLFLLFATRLLLQITDGATRRGLSQLVQHPQSVSLQIIGFTIILTSVFVTGMVRTHLIESWKETLPAQTPNYFAFNIAPADQNGLSQLFVKNHIPQQAMYPITRGRLVSINHQPVLSVLPESAKGHNALNRELNLSSMDAFPADNKIVFGGAWQEANSNSLSIEESLARDLKLHMGDVLTFQIGEAQVSGTIYNIRKVEWTSFHPNFYIIFKPGTLDSFPTTYLSSFHLKAEQTAILNTLAQTFPNITVIDIASVLQQIQLLISKIALGIQYLFFFTIASGVLIFITVLQSSLDERRQTYRILRILGASQKYIYKSMAVEFTTLFLLIICCSAILAKWIGNVLIHIAF